MQPITHNCHEHILHYCDWALSTEIVYADFRQQKIFANFVCGHHWQIFFLQNFSHGAMHCTLIGPSTTFWRVAHALGEIFVTIQSMSHWRNF